MKRFTVIVRRPPHGTAHGRELVEAAMMAGALDHDTTVAFLDDGVFQLKAGQQPDQVGGVPVLGPAAALLADGLARVVVENESMAERGLTLGDLAVAATPLSRTDIAALLGRSDVVLTA